MLICAAAPAGAYNVVNLPQSMTMSDALGIFDTSEITGISVSEIGEGKHIDLTEDEIDEFFELAADMEVYRTTNPTPFRGIAVDVRTGNTTKSYYLNSGVQIGLYGENNYVCYKLADSDTEKLLYLDSMYRDDTNKKNNEAVLNRDSSRDFLKLPEAIWAQSFAKAAAAKNLLPYEFTDKYSSNITREEFCILLANFIAVKENYASLDLYMFDRGVAYSESYFEDCGDVDNSVNMLYALGIVNGKDENHFDPHGTITREEAATLLSKTAEMYIWLGVETKLKYSDRDDISLWAKFYSLWVTENGIMTGVTTDEFMPQGSYTVEQAVATVIRLYNYFEK